MGRNQPRRRNNPSERQAEKLEAALHGSWSVDQQQPRNLCDRHFGEAFPPRCADCDTEEVKAAAAQIQARLNPTYPIYRDHTKHNDD